VDTHLSGSFQRAKDLVFSFHFLFDKGELMYHTCSRECGYKDEESYTGFDFLRDAVMLIITGGLWFIWIFVREMRNR
jgi:hypothetical protein